MEPLISIRLPGHTMQYDPGEKLACQYQVDGVSSESVQAIEASVLWYTEGKGDDDLSVHYFERHVAAELDNEDLQQMWSFETVLPNSPLSYDGVILKLHWCIRIRVFQKKGKEIMEEQRFRLGRVPNAVSAEPPKPEAEAGM